MKNLLTKITASVAGAVLVCLGFVLAGLGISVVAILAMFVLAAAGLGAIASPFVSLLEPTETGDEQLNDTATAA